MTGDVLFLAHRMPFPPNRGDKIRSHHVLRRLAELGPVHVATFADDAADLAEEPTLARLAASHLLVRRRKSLVRAGLEALASGAPVSQTAFADQALRGYVEKLLRQQPIAAIYVFSGQMGQYVPAWYQGRVIADFVDVDSAKFEAYGAGRLSPRGWIDRREGRLLCAEEARLACRADVSLLISRPEADLFASRLSGDEQGRCSIQVMGNGIDADYFDAGAVRPEPQLLACEGPRLIFTGQMDYAPNVAAAVRMAREILPLVRAGQFPAATFHVVGRSPEPEVEALAALPGCHVWGGVPDIRTWLAAADLAVVPLNLARGIQNKVLEAMAMGLPVVLTSEAATGIAARPGHDFAVADSNAELARAITALCRDPAAARVMGRAARAFVCESMSWTAALAPLKALVAGSDEARRHAA